LASLGDAYTRHGFYEEGLSVDSRLVELKPEEPLAHYNLACSLSLVGNINKCKSELKKSVALGYSDFAYILEDPDMKNLRNDEHFCEFFRNLKKPAKP
jgi:hypothetical protein